MFTERILRIPIVNMYGSRRIIPLCIGYGIVTIPTISYVCIYTYNNQLSGHTIPNLSLFAIFLLRSFSRAKLQSNLITEHVNSYIHICATHVDYSMTFSEIDMHYFVRLLGNIFSFFFWCYGDDLTLLCVYSSPHYI